jgi:predicted GIY-YIG superfamily endonuclease
MASDKQGHRDRRPQTARRYSDATPRHPVSTRWLVYLLRCSDGSLYTGITNDLPKRLKAHAAGKASRYTRSRLPVTLVYSEPHRSKSAALKREAAIKKLSRPQKDRLMAVKPTSRSRAAVSLTTKSVFPEAP